MRPGRVRGVGIGVETGHVWVERITLPSAHVVVVGAGAGAGVG